MFVDLKPNVNNKDIYKIELFMNTSVVFEEIRAKRTIPQCTRCQCYGHKENFCRLIPNCVKCIAPKHTLECTRKVKYANVNCVDCCENHPANKRNCLVYKQSQQNLKKNYQHHICSTRNILQSDHTEQIISINSK